jgi:hypothetical protein
MKGWRGEGVKGGASFHSQQLFHVKWPTFSSLSSIVLHSYLRFIQQRTSPETDEQLQSTANLTIKVWLFKYKDIYSRKYILYIHFTYNSKRLFCCSTRRGRGCLCRATLHCQIYVIAFLFRDIIFYKDLKLFNSFQLAFRISSKHLDQKI